MPLYPPPTAAGGALDITYLRKAIDPTLWAIGDNVVLTANGGQSELVSVSLRVTVALVGAGASIGWFMRAAGVSPIIASNGVANYAAGNVGDSAGFTNSAANGPAKDPLYQVAIAGSDGGIMLNSVRNANAMYAALVAALITAGSIEAVFGYIPQTVGATLT